MWLENVQNWPKIDPKMLKIRQIDLKISKKCVSYCKIPTRDKNLGTSPSNPTAGPQTYWEAPSQLPTQFAPLPLINNQGIIIQCQNHKIVQDP